MTPDVYFLEREFTNFKSKIGQFVNSLTYTQEYVRLEEAKQMLLLEREEIEKERQKLEEEKKQWAEMKQKLYQLKLDLEKERIYQLSNKSRQTLYTIEE
jgi:hypothetical protein